MLRPATEHFPLIANWILRQNKKTGAVLAHRALELPLLNQIHRFRVETAFTNHQSRVTSHSYFFGRDSGGTNPDTR